MPDVRWGRSPEDRQGLARCGWNKRGGDDLIADLRKVVDAVEGRT